MKSLMLAGELYLADNPQLAADYKAAQALVEQFNACASNDDAGRFEVLNELVAEVADATVIRSPLRCEYGYQTRIGARVFANWGLVLLDVAHIAIGDDVQMGPNVQLLTATHPLDPTLRRSKWESAKPIMIGDNVWLGGGVIVCPGVSIGEDTVVAAGAVVIDDLPPRVLAGGVPARRHQAARLTASCARRRAPSSAV